MIDRETLQAIAERLNQQQVLLCPTDIGWAICCDATSPEAVKKLFQIVPANDPNDTAILVADDNMLHRYVRNIPDVAWDIVDAAQKATILVLDQPVAVAEPLFREDKSAAYCISHIDTCQQIIKKFRRPLAALALPEKSAPHNNYITPEIKTAVDYIVDLPNAKAPKKSSCSIIRLHNDGRVQILRK